MRSPFYEAALEKQGLTFEYVEKVHLDDIDGPKSLRNQARLEVPVDDDLVGVYAAHMKDGVQFPPLVAWQPPRGKKVLIDGNQRFAALRKIDRRTTDCYVVTNQEEMVIDRVTWVFNNLVNGKRLTAEECLRHAVGYVRKHGRSVKEAAQEWSLTVNKVSRAIRVEDTREALLRQNVKRVSSLSDDVVEELATLHHVGEDVMAKAAKVVVENGLGQRDTREIVATIKTAPTHEAKVAAVEEAARSEVVENSRARTKGGTVKPKALPAVRFTAVLKQARSLLEQYGNACRPSGAKAFEETRAIAEDFCVQLHIAFGLGARREAQ